MHDLNVVDSSKRLIPRAAVSLGASSDEVGDAVAAVKPADPKPLIGARSIAFLEDAGVIIKKPDLPCDNPSVISAGPNDMISNRIPKWDAVNWAVKPFGGRNPLRRDNGFDQTLIPDWIDADRFPFAGKDASGVKTDWIRAKQWTRWK